MPKGTGSQLRVTTAFNAGSMTGGSASGSAETLAVIAHLDLRRLPAEPIGTGPRDANHAPPHEYADTDRLEPTEATPQFVRL